MTACTSRCGRLLDTRHYPNLISGAGRNPEWGNLRLKQAVYWLGTKLHKCDIELFSGTHWAIHTGFAVAAMLFPATQLECQLLNCEWGELASLTILESLALAHVVKPKRTRA